MYAGTSVTSPGGRIAAEILVGGIPQPLYGSDPGRRYVVGVPGAAYSVRVTNLAGRRVEVIASVDQRHVLDDEAADLARVRGLVINGLTAGSSVYEFQGWQTSGGASGRARQFTFGTVEASVAAASTGSAAGVGTIGLAAYRERSYPVASYAAALDCSAPVTRGATRGLTVTTAAAASPGLGTGMGADVASPLGTTDFTRDNSAPDLITVHYDTQENLRALGVLGHGYPEPLVTGPTGYANPRYAG